jgi:lincosamide nucleotidyltransferase A/C/D/E
MDAEHAIELIQFLEQHGLEVYVDGGWAVDALLGHQTRAHLDLDIAIPHKQVPRLREMLAAKGYEQKTRDDTWECNFVLGNGSGQELDVHSYELDDEGNNIFGVEYRREHLCGSGVINGCPVRCIAPEWLIKFHSGYKLDENDYLDVKALCERFGFALPDEYQKFVR